MTSIAAGLYFYHYQYYNLQRMCLCVNGGKWRLHVFFRILVRVTDRVHVQVVNLTIINLMQPNAGVNNQSSEYRNLAAYKSEK